MNDFQNVEEQLTKLDIIERSEQQKAETFEKINTKLNGKRKVQRKRWFPQVLTAAFAVVLLFAGYQLLKGDIFDSSDAFQEVIASYPEEIQTEIDKLPNGFEEMLVVPTKLPESLVPISFGFQTTPDLDPNGKVIFTDFIYADPNNPKIHLLLTTFYASDVISKPEKTYETIMLENGMEAEIRDDLRLSWKNEETGQTHELAIVVHPDITEPNITLDDLVEIANSMD